MSTLPQSLLGVNGFAVVLPQILAGIASVIVLFHLVRRSFGNLAGLVAALALAVTPVAIAVERNNTPDGTLIFTLLLEGWARAWRCAEDLGCSARRLSTKVSGQDLAAHRSIVRLEGRGLWIVHRS